MIDAGYGRRTLIAVIVSAITACTSASPANPEVRASAAYDAIVRWFALESDDDPEPLPVFVEPRGEGASIGLDIQAELVTSVQDVATVRFIDSRDEALVTNDEGALVAADDGMLLRLAPVVEVGRTIRLDVDVHQHDEQFRTLQFELSLAGDRWVVDRAPLDVPSG